MFVEIKSQAQIDRELRLAKIAEIIGDILGGIALFVILICLALAPLVVGG